ncbi:aminotransferase-like domain-containing protein [Herbiconiux daphne]|uniref:Aminotransferase class I/II-fold pyridoxal phosphate-dependent enzyme n=1 Tax=Herbiconiux daphne TaxID=2970914 RepID=A0ABT2H386_9MICO|nr:aminotransferase class I/II-fold pyridoxal phosphate-dependent enzyme [Herbiconiux daphne]MCS5734367.1 aminotransferase class I/II-fold pyridoxal phosphate-dependent enzyme [Herbiconiux daphne]
MKTAAEHILSRVPLPTAAGVADALRALIDDGTLLPGDILPTVRELASELSMSPTTVHEAWKDLRTGGYITTDGRRGTYVLSANGIISPRSYRTFNTWRQKGTEPMRLDLSTGAPDTALLPSFDLVRDLSSVLVQSNYHEYLVAPELESALRDTWGTAYVPPALTVVDGSLDALDRILTAIVNPGDFVLIDDPTFPPIRHILDFLGARVVPIPLDASGPRPAEVRVALERRPTAFVFQPRAQNPTGVAITAERRDVLAGIITGSDMVVVEEDSAGDVSDAPLVTLAGHLPEQVVRIHGFSKSHGPDLRLAAVGGSAELIQHLVTRRYMGSAWSSRILQVMLARLLTNPEASETLRRARQIYRDRRVAFVDALAAHGIRTIGDDGFNVWVPVVDEQLTAVSLAMDGIGVATGSAFQVSGSSSAFCRVTTSALPVEQAHHIAGLIAHTAQPLQSSRLTN